MIRDLSINKESDAPHALAHAAVHQHGRRLARGALRDAGGGEHQRQAITLANKHKAVKSAAEFKGFKFGVPFDYSMHNFLLRYVVAEAGLDPDKDIQIRAVPPPEMVANLRAGNLDGYLGPDPFNQRAVYENEGFIFMLSKDIWPGHPCCAFAARKDFAESAPNSFGALLRAIVDATSSPRQKNRKEIAAAIAPRNYLNRRGRWWRRC